MRSPFLTEAIAEFSVGIFLAILRLFARWRLVGFRQWGGDDYFVIAAAVFWVVEITPVILVGTEYGSNTGWTEAERAKFSDAEIAPLEKGSQWVIVGWFAYVTTLWALKASMLFFYDRITAGLYQQKIVRGCAVYCALSYVAVFFTMIFHCRPFHKNWQVYPDPGRECTAHYTLYPVVASLNVLSDFVLVAIPIPMLIKLQVKLIHKIMVGALLCSGIFISAAAMLRCILTLSNLSQINIAAIWSFVAMAVVNAPALKPLFTPSTWTNRSKNTGSGSNTYPLSSTTGNANKPRKIRTVTGKHDSQESIFSGPEEVVFPATFKCDVSEGARETVGERDGIQVTTEYETKWETV